ncbi:hypothetical protein LO769_06965 [Lactococcus lactis subsp. lactis]|uniref:hypothetical protein n=1 Tax=Lactococcus lactis TaxID=1358 RepID=UPI002078BE49|nr:hypothetical protein [Lactococcus lactis]USI62155.1 hypothetical protein LO769_06965 [Lactococcus lactis subsp. lactis]
MTQETEKERIYREALDEINNLAIDVAMDFEETGIGSVDCGKIMDIVNKAFFAEANQQPSSTDKLSVEKLQEQLNTAKKYIEHAIGTIKHDGHLGTIQTDWILPYLEKVLAAIGGDR